MNNLEMMRKRFEYQGGTSQEARMIKDKYNSFKKSLLYSYQGCDVEKVQPFDSCLPAEGTHTVYRALINPDKTKQDYDDKILSIDYDTHFGPGDVFQWKGTDSYWLIYLQYLTEDAYFRGEIRRCKYQIKFKDEDGNYCSTWAAVRGPVETQIKSASKNSITIDRPNFSLHILLPMNDKTLRAFDRYSEFLFQGKCWRVESTDTISAKNVLEINAEEYYVDKDKDDILNEVADGLVIESPEPPPSMIIQGETFIKPRIGEVFTATEAGGTWKVLEDYPVCINKIDDKSVEVIWRKSTSGQFTLEWSKGNTTETKVIVVESLF